LSYAQSHSRHIFSKKNKKTINKILKNTATFPDPFPLAAWVSFHISCVMQQLHSKNDETDTRQRAPMPQSLIENVDSFLYKKKK
jgi:hypothetical protein